MKEVNDFEIKWNMLKKKDSSQVNELLYAVKTTGIFCRIGCSSKLPKKKNVEFFNSVMDAENSGYRACKKCRPVEIVKNGNIIDLVVSDCRTIESSDEILSLNQLAADGSYSSWHLQKIFKEITGITPKEYSRGLRENKFKEKLSSSVSITEAMYNSGFGSSSRLYEYSREWLAMKPKEYKNGGYGQQIHFGIKRCSLGYMLIGSTSIGICSVDIGDDPEKLVDQLLQRFPM